MNKSYFFVFNEQRDKPRHRHATYEKALQEAKRLAALNPGEVFLVLQALAEVRRNDISVTKLLDSDSIPFPF